jgi:hypothetical protein
MRPEPHALVHAKRRHAGNVPGKGAQFQNQDWRVQLGPGPRDIDQMAVQFAIVHQPAQILMSKGGVILKGNG